MAATLSISELPRHWSLRHNNPQHIVVYLHGFGSSMLSAKACAIEDALFQRGYSFLRFTFDDMQADRFFHLTVPKMVDQLRRIVDTLAGAYERIHLIGSSLGAMVLARYCEQGASPAVASLTTLAGSFDFYANRLEGMGADGLQVWKEKGFALFYHYGVNDTIQLGTAFLEDVESYMPYRLRTRLPFLLIHGKRDETVSFEQSVAMASEQPLATLKLYEAGDHSLMGDIDEIIRDIAGHLLPLSSRNADAVADCVHSPAVLSTIQEEIQ
ncbi:alpha/beta fold hydrolase [Desulfurispirillum indicum]|uniref:Uncharacterized protein n=1 Tax=Desulfurispirillum indicum (strain ATCC BAA-1389 / DSM 22839 / S5) TaxID=653733 RepID=E6W1K1_DESIS|nr:alpha/beta fold hydrolase [Desulfurispirillum indicum]ADU66550.1 protein of unknown function UPF0227 [Desulfurispirillum indicum S5]UCZ55871.1 alpha/beta fold hydrolase [Desulfurispirillum indicum]